MELTPPGLAADDEMQNKMRSPDPGEMLMAPLDETDQEASFNGVSTVPIFLLGLLTILLMCALVALMWFLEELWLTPPDVYYGDYDDNEDADESEDDSNQDHYDDYLNPDDGEYTDGEMDPFPKIPAPTVTVRIKTKTRRTPRTAKSTSRTPTSAPPNLNPCTTTDCHRQSHYLKQQLNFSARPCQDFYNFACGNYKGHPEGPYYQAENALRTATISALKATRVPATGQSAWQKAAGIFQGCTTFTSSEDTEFAVLKSWMVWLNLDPLNLAASWTVDPVDMVVRLALDLGVPAVFDFKLSDRTFIGGKRAMQFRISDMRQDWLKIRDALMRRNYGPILVRRSYSYLLSSYPGYNSGRHRGIAEKLYSYDEAFITAVRKHVNGSTPFITAAIREMANYTSSHVTSEQWSDSLARHTNGTYTGGNKIRFQKELLQALTELLASSDWGPDGLRALLSWSLLQGLNSYMSPGHLVPAGTDSEEVCYDHVVEAMDFAVTSRYLRPKVTMDAMKKATAMFFIVSRAMSSILRHSTWLKNPARDVALQKLAKMKAQIGSPDQRLNKEFVNEYYASFPDMAPTDRFLDTWLKTRSARAHQKWADQTHVFFNMSRATAYYVYEGNIVVVPAGALQPVFFYNDGNPALNYGTLGDALAHRIMNAYDVAGIQYDDNEQLNPWITKNARARYVSRALCLRESHAKARRSVHKVSSLDDFVDSENIGDLVGAATAYQALRSLPSDQRTQTLPGLNLTADQLYFVGHCMTLCKRDSRKSSGRYASPRARCNVPAMNMAAFSSAFGCRITAPMNPYSKCSFWM